MNRVDRGEVGMKVGYLSHSEYGKGKRRRDKVLVESLKECMECYTEKERVVEVGDIIAILVIE